MEDSENIEKPVKDEHSSQIQTQGKETIDFSSESNSCKTVPEAIKKTNRYKSEDDDGTISLSKQLLNKRKPRKCRVKMEKSQEKRHVTGCPMPSRAVLKKMFLSSDEEDADSNLTSETLMEIASKAIDIIENRPKDIIEEIIDPKLAVIPQKRKRKRSTPHIVHATVKVEGKGFNARVGVGDLEYGVKRTFSEDSDSPGKPGRRRKKKKKTKPQNKTSELSTKQNNILCRNGEMYSENQKQEEVKSDDTECYDVGSFSVGTVKFSPIPSTSRDNETFEKNDLLLQSSIMDIENDEVQIIDTPYETITIDDSLNPDVTEIRPLDNFPEVIIDTDSNTEISLLNDSSIPFYTNFRDMIHEINNNSNDDCEIIDVDSIIAENNSVLEKYNTRKSTNISKVIDLSETKENSDIEVIDISYETNNNLPLKEGVDCNKDNHIANIVRRFFNTYKPQSDNHQMPNAPKSQFNSLLQKSTISQHLETIYTNILAFINPICKPSKDQQRVTRIDNYTEAIILDDDIHTPDVNSITKMGNTSKSSNRNELYQIPQAAPESPKQTSRTIGDCPICMESLTNKPMASTICGHIFCMACIQAVVKTPGGKKCPTCRKPFKKNANFHPIFL